MLSLDHIAIATPDLATGTAWAEMAFGVPLEPGGTHAEMGTHNRLLSLGPEEYLEVIAIDPDGAAPGQPRWFDLDRFRGPTGPGAWIARVPDLDAAIAAAPDGIGVAWSLSRADLRWRMAIPADGRLPFDGLFPALIEWEGAAHPAPRLPDRGVRLTGLTLAHPQAEALRAALAPVFSDPRLEIVAEDSPYLGLRFDTARGPLDL
ncbi:VOC family protein [Rhodophyticola porphyridii]|uniref:VOC family protein n=1 Tax=Rhodophyticola porphyridii TaxID=1852017 RepID=A0A3L9Y2G1_9RHOB|nr:VOC family protein [Rhodophyticola porphyridii]RMA41625.1 VOC family protein [Rhodophyticola porphyridii]